jgi:hypothetical protein
MKKLLLAAAVTMIASSAIAQTSTTTTVTTTVSPADETKIKEYIVKEKRTSINPPSGFTVSNGAVVPEAVELYSFPNDVSWSKYRYTVIGGQTVLVDPANRHIIQVIR